jgi:phosphomannomutase/phosphoglucomutase
VVSVIQEKINMLAQNMALLDPSIFRMYDIRGIVGKTLTDEHTYLIGKAYGSYIQELGEKRVVVARDGRLSSPVLAPALSEGLISAGCDVINIGLQPTPLLYFALSQFDSRCGLMVTGSHNPKDYNGIKGVVNGKSLSPEEIQEL